MDGWMPCPTSALPPAELEAPHSHGCTVEVGWGAPCTYILINNKKGTLNRFHTAVNFRVLAPGIMDPVKLCPNGQCFYLLEI